jgi:N-acetylmuramoyl-L-alanine amidase
MYSYLMNTILKQILYLAIIIFFIHAFSNCINAQNNTNNQRVVVLDAGHGGKDSGAVGKKGKEKDIVLKLALQVGKYLEENLPSVKVIYTRDKDVFIPLHKRADIANKNGADVFVSIHVNSNPNTRPTGTETFAMGLHKTQGNLAVAQKENAVIVYEEDYTTTYEGYDPSSAESYIIFSLMQNAYLDQSLELASLVQDEFRERAKRKDRGVKQAGFLVLWNTTMPSVLVEAGFISNVDEEKYLLSDQGQDYISSAIYRAIKNYLIKLDEIDNASYEDNSNLQVQVDSAPAGHEFKTIVDSIFFKVQISSSSNKIPLDSTYFKGFDNIGEYFTDGLYKYTVGKSPNIKEIKKIQKEVKKEFPDAFIVAFKNGNKIPVDQAIKESKN